MPFDEIVALVKAERQRQFDLPGTEGDVMKNPNDWIITIMSLLCEGQSRNMVIPAEDFQRALIKATAVSIAALEHVDLMISKERLS